MNLRFLFGYNAKKILMSLVERPNFLLAIKNVIWLFLDKLIRILGGIFVGAWVARHLGPQDYGVLSYVLSYVGFFLIVVSMGLNGPVVRRLINIPAEKYETITSAFVIQLISSVGLYLLALLTIWFVKFEEKQLIHFVSIYGVILVFRSSDVIRFYFESRVLSKYVVVSDNVVFLIVTILKVWLILLGLDLEWFVWLLATESALYAFGLILIFKIKGCDNFRVHSRMNSIRELFKESWPIAMSSIFVAISLNIDKLALGQFFLPAELGVYAAASVIVVTWFFVPVAVGGSVAPRLNRMHNEDIDGYKKYSAKLYNYVTAGSALIALLVCIYSDGLISILYGHQYQRSAEVLAVLIWSIVFISIVSIRGRLLVIEGKNKMVARLTFYGAFASVALSLLIIPGHGAIGAAVAFLSSWGVGAVVVPIIHKETRIHALMALCISKRV